jgi:hypothetical protein
MQIEKKLILCSILAIAIGIATIIPLEYLMTGENQATAAALTDIRPWFNVDVPYAYCNPNVSGGNNTSSWAGASIEIVANFTLTTDALQNADAQIEFYKFAVSSDQGHIVDLGYYIVEDRANVVTGICGDGTITFANGLTYNGPDSSGGQCINWQAWSPDSVLGFVSKYMLEYNGNDASQAVTQIRNAQTLYVDVSKVSTVTVSGDLTATTPADNQTLQHIELTKTDNGFVYGTYVSGSLPIPIQTPPVASSTPSIVWTPTFGPNNTTQP